jgi:riboflavin kinase/FMN adenylyltransferase
VDGARSLRARAGTSLVAIGNFDGVHVGHRAVIGAAAAEARQRGLVPLVLTFHPHPAEVLGRGSLPLLTSIDRKAELICRIDPEVRVVVEPFTPDLAKQEPRQFVEELLVQALGARVVIVGQNFRFGHNRAGKLETLVRLGAELGFEARAEELAGDAAGTYSSTRARELLKSADLGVLERVLGRPHSISGRVVHGDQRGKSLGFPTANLDGIVEALPPHGVYAVLVDQLGAGVPARSKALARGVANFGVRPTVGAGQSFEVHLFDFEGDLYGQSLRVHLVERLRGEQRFASLAELKAQIERDCAAARTVTDARVPDPDATGAWY